MTKVKIALVVGSVAAILSSGLAAAMWMANGIVYGSLVGLKGREHDLALAHERATIALTAAVALQVVAMLASASWLPRARLSGVTGTAVRFVLALAISLAGAGVALLLILEISRLAH